MFQFFWAASHCAPWDRGPLSASSPAARRTITDAGRLRGLTNASVPIRTTSRRPARFSRNARRRQGLDRSPTRRRARVPQSTTPAASSRIPARARHLLSGGVFTDPSGGSADQLSLDRSAESRTLTGATRPYLPDGPHGSGDGFFEASAIRRFADHPRTPPPEARPESQRAVRRGESPHRSVARSAGKNQNARPAVILRRRVSSARARRANRLARSRTRPEGLVAALIPSRTRCRSA